MQLYETGGTPERKGILSQRQMLKVPECLFISRPDGRLAISCWPSPSLPLFIEQPRDPLNDTGQWQRWEEGVQKSEMEPCLLSETCCEVGGSWNADLSPGRLLLVNFIVLCRCV